MNNSHDFIFKIGILGPTRVGKTSLVAAVLQNSTYLLSGTPVSMAAFDSKTEKRLSQHHKELEGSIRARDFHPGAVSGTEESFTYELRLDPGVDGAAGIRFSLLDYPGGWIDSNKLPAARKDEWTRCKEWIKDSSVLLVPIESAVMMEAEIAAHKKAVPFILNTHDVELVARDWAKARAKNQHAPALLIFCPVKCETYFNDNGGRRDDSVKLLRHVEDYYRDVIDAVRQEAAGVQILYAPVDTVGCCEINNARWNMTVDNPSFSADYLVRQPARQSIKGAEAVLVSLCRLMVDAGKRAEDDIARQKINAAQEAQAVANLSRTAANEASAYAHRDEGFFRNFWLELVGERQRRERVAENRRLESEKHQHHANQKDISVQAQQQVLESFDETIQRLAKEPMGTRARKL
ncbi:MAG: hypothetical protein PHF20_07755 [Halothiobacillaceae bacterium]|nr:hypothetical protein [Halothiobacillaceae bacterium]